MKHFWPPSVWCHNSQMPTTPWYSQLHLVPDPPGNPPGKEVWTSSGHKFLLRYLRFFFSGKDITTLVNFFLKIWVAESAELRKNGNCSSYLVDMLNIWNLLFEWRNNIFQAISQLAVFERSISWGTCNHPLRCLEKNPIPNILWICMGLLYRNSSFFGGGTWGHSNLEASRHVDIAGRR